MNSYWVGQDSTFKFYEVILVDTAHKVKPLSQFNKTTNSVNEENNSVGESDDKQLPWMSETILLSRKN